MGHLVVAWYGWLSQLAQGPILAIESWNDALDVPTLSALLFGLIGATSPCQLTTNLGALAFSASRPGRLGPVWASLSYALGKVAVYFMVGAAVIFLGFGLQAASIPVVVVARKLLGPLMLVIGLGLIGWIRLPRGPGGGVGEAIKARLPGRGQVSVFLLGIAFSFAFCPTLFWLFFGLTLPLALRSHGGWAFPGLFAVGTTLPLLAVAAGVALGLGTKERLAGSLTRLHRAVRWAAGGLFILGGLHDTIVYWWL